MLSQRFGLMEFCVCSLRRDITELAANPFSEHMQTFLFAFHSHRQHHLTLKACLDEDGSLFVGTLSARQTKQTGWQEALQMYISDVKR